MKKILRITVFIILTLAVVNIFAIDLFMWLSTKDNTCDGSIANIELHGSLVTYNTPDSYDKDGFLMVDQTASEDIIESIEKADRDADVQAIVIEIDSSGGGPVAAEEIAQALRSAKKPTVALIREYGTSGAYWAATGADRIFVSKNSDVGGIGVTMSYLDYSKKNATEGILFQQISSGKFKDTGDPNKPLTVEERKYLERDIAVLHDNFVKNVAENRGLDIEKVRGMADGSSMLGQTALEKGLVDEIGGIPEIKKFLASKYNIHSDVCAY